LVLAAALLGPACAAPSSADEGDGDDTTEDEITSTKKVTPNDVSILFPLPSKAKVGALLGAASAGPKGELVPAAVFAKLPPLIMSNEDVYAKLRVVALRVDPCFAVPGAPETACKNQLRLVLQPINTDEESDATDASDAAIHVFYDLSRAELATFVKKSLELKKASGGYRTVPLKVHPMLEKQGLDSAYGKGLSQLVLETAGKQNLSRVTFMTREGSRQEQWKFGGFDVAGSRVTAMKIATMGNETIQTVANPGFGASLFRLTVTPRPLASDNISILFQGQEAIGRPKAEVQKAYDAALRIENPGKHSPDTMDCVSCHTTHGRLGIESALGFSATGNPNTFVSSVSTKGANVTGGGALHAFSYKGSVALVSQRTANETASVCEYINAKVLAQR
jgi:hypothetical protein